MQAPSARAQELQEQVRHHNRLYWDEAAPEISDLEYDGLVRELRKLWPEAPVLAEMGPSQRAPKAAPGASDLERLGTEVVHKEPMLSLDKAYTDEELLKWTDKVRGDFLLMPKVDGIASSIHYNADGRLMLAATRGDGERGDDITANVRAGKLAPEKIDVGACEVRGEIFMKKSRFAQAYAQEFANPRNLTAGAIKQKDPQKSAAYGLSFLAYDLRGLGLPSEEQKLRRLKELGFQVIPFEVVQAAECAPAYLRMASQRATWDFEADGVVFKANLVSEQDRLGITAHHPRFALAYKFQGESARARIEEILWNVSRNGTITPIARIEPTPLSGVTVSRASLHHAGYIRKLGITQGATLLVMRRGDVIPHVEGVVVPGTTPFEIPKTCPSCGSPTQLDGDFLRCTTPQRCPDALVGVIRHFTSVMDIQGLGPKLIATLCQNGLLRSPADLFRLTPEQLLPLERMGETLANKIVANIQARREVPLPVFLTSLGIDELGPTVAELLCGHYADLAGLKQATESELGAIHGVGPSIAHSVVQGLQEKAGELAALMEFVRFSQPARAVPTDHPLSGKSVVFTGALQKLDRKNAQKRVQQVGGKTPSGVTRELDYLVVGEEKDGAESSKLKAAKKLMAQGSAVKVLTEEEFLHLLG